MDEKDKKEEQGIIPAKAKDIVEQLPEKQRRILEPLLSPEKVHEALNTLSEEHRAILQSAIYEEVEMTAIFSGPLPPPQTLDAYEKVVPGSAKEMMDNFNNANKTEIEIAKDKMKKGGRGQILGFSLAIFFGIIALISVLTNHETFAGIIGGGTIISLAIIFVLGQQPKVKRNNSKN